MSRADSPRSRGCHRLGAVSRVRQQRSFLDHLRNFRSQRTVVDAPSLPKERMMGDRALSRRGFLAASAAAGLGMTALSGCGGDSDGGSSDGTTTIEWWNISTTEPAKTVWAGLAKKFEAQNPKVKVKIVQLENDAYKSKMTALTASGKLPDIFHTWGGGVLKQQVDAGLVKDLTSPISSWSGSLSPVSLAPYQFDSKTYAVPFDIGMVGFWYNKALFTKAGISAP